MSELFAQVGGAAGILSVIFGIIWTVVNRRKISAEASEAMNKAAAIADEAVTKRVQSLKTELWEALDLSDQRRTVMAKMDNAIWTMRIRIERHANWDREVKVLLDRLLVALSEHRIDFTAHVHEPPSLDLSDVDFDFTIHPPKKQ